MIIVILNEVREVKNPGLPRCEQPNSLDPIIRTALNDTMGHVQRFPGILHFADSVQNDNLSVQRFLRRPRG